MMKILGYGVIAVIALAAIGALTDSGQEQAEPAASTAADTQSAPETSEPAEEPESNPVPVGKYGMASCDLGGGNGSIDSESLIGSTEVINTGEVPFHATVNFKWQLGNGSWIKAEPKQARVNVSGEKLVFFEMPIDLDTALSFQDHPGYFDGDNCKTNTAIR